MKWITISHVEYIVSDEGIDYGARTEGNLLPG